MDVHRFNSTLLDIVAELHKLPAPLRRVTAAGMHDGRALAQALAPLTGLRCLELNSYQSAVPGTLTALTKLSVECNDGVLECPVDKFTALEVCIRVSSPDHTRGAFVEVV